MTDAFMEICPFEQESHPSNGGLRDAFAEVMRRRYAGAVNVQGRLMSDFGLSVDQAKGLLAGKTSIGTMEDVLQHKNGGWRIGLAVLSIVVGRRLTDYFASEKDRLDHEAEQRRQRADRLREAERLLNAADVGPDGPAYAGMGHR